MPTIEETIQIKMHPITKHFIRESLEKEIVYFVRHARNMLVHPFSNFKIDDVRKRYVRLRCIGHDFGIDVNSLIIDKYPYYWQTLAEHLDFLVE